MTGYLHPSYPQSLAEFGTPRSLGRSGGWLLERNIPGLTERDAMACYPLLICRDWSSLKHDLEELRPELVSVCVVTDPLGNYAASMLQDCFPQLARPFKEHFVVDLAHDLDAFVSKHHRLAVKRALRKVEVECVADPLSLLDEWTEFYSHLIDRHDLRGMLTFSRRVFERQLQVPGLVTFRTRQGAHSLGLVQWYQQEDVAYLHLAAYSEAGYKVEASYAAFWSALEHFARAGVRLLNLGAGAGLQSNGDDGLSKFKRGWSNGTRTGYLCGRIVNHERYDALAGQRNGRPTAYFPAYRVGEFG